MIPDRCLLDQGSFLFRLGFDHWVTSLSAGSTGLFLFGWNPFRSIHVLQRSIAIGIYVKRKKWKAQPAGVVTISGITFFRTISLPHFCFPCNTGFRTKNFRINGGKGRIQNIWLEDNWQEKAAVVQWQWFGAFPWGALLFRSRPQRNDPWRFRQQSSRVISIQFWYLTSWLPRFL